MTEQPRETDEGTTTMATTADDRGFLDALNALFDTEDAEYDPYLVIRGAIAQRPITQWRPLAAAATVLAKAGMTPVDIAEYGLPVTEALANQTSYGRHDQIAELVAELAAMHGLTGSSIRTIQRTVERVAHTFGGL